MALLICEVCGDDQQDDDSIQLRVCGHVVCEFCSTPCPICADEDEEEEHER